MLALLSRQHAQLTVFLDAINEHRDLRLLSRSIAEFLGGIVGKPVAVLASCRDVYWPFINTDTWPSTQWNESCSSVGNYTRSEIALARTAYLRRYRVTAKLSGNAAKKLAHPLILRFFCEAYGYQRRLARYLWDVSKMSG